MSSLHFLCPLDIPRRERMLSRKIIRVILSRHFIALQHVRQIGRAGFGHSEQPSRSPAAIHGILYLLRLVGMGMTRRMTGHARRNYGKFLIADMDGAKKYAPPCISTNSPRLGICGLLAASSVFGAAPRKGRATPSGVWPMIGSIPLLG
jgi:hypothetical protein